MFWYYGDYVRIMTIHCDTKHRFDILLIFEWFVRITMIHHDFINIPTIIPSISLVYVGYMKFVKITRSHYDFVKATYVSFEYHNVS